MRKRPPVIQMIGVASIFYGVADPLLVFFGGLVGLEIGSYGPAFAQFGRVPVVILLLAGGFGVLTDRTWSRFVYWLLPMYSMIVTLVLMPAVFRALPIGGDIWGSLEASALYWPIITATFYPVAFIVSSHFWNLEQSGFLPRPDELSQREQGRR